MRGSVGQGTSQASSDVVEITCFGVLLNGSEVTLCSPSDSEDMKCSDGKRVSNWGVKVL